jgi:hypothetical protein
LGLKLDGFLVALICICELIFNLIQAGELNLIYGTQTNVLRFVEAQLAAHLAREPIHTGYGRYYRTSTLCIAVFLLGSGGPSQATE